MLEDARKFTGTLKSGGLDYFLSTEDAEFFLLNVTYIYRNLVGCEVVVEGIATGMDTILVRELNPAPEPRRECQRGSGDA